MFGKMPFYLSAVSALTLLINKPHVYSQQALFIEDRTNG